MYRVLKILTDAEVAECRKIAASAPFVDGRITNPHNTTKQNEQLHDAQAYQKSSQLLLQAFKRSEEFREFAFPVVIAPPLITRYKPGMKYGAHADAAYMQLPNQAIRSDLSCTIFLNEPRDYEGGELHIQIGDAHREGEFVKLFAAGIGLLQDLRTLLIGLRVVQLLVLLRLIVRIGNPTVRERRVGSDPLALGDFLFGQ